MRERLRQLVARHPIESAVVAPVPWFPSRSPLFGRYAEFARVPARETADGVQVFHPRFVVVPKIGDAVTPLSYYRSIRHVVRSEMLADYDVIDAHYAFPDGAAAVLLGRKLNKPVVLTVRGSDINLMPREVAAGRWIRWTLPRCDAIVAVSEDLARRVASLTGGVAKVTVLQNGVDRDKFTLLNRPAVKRELDLAGPVVLSVGNLIELKGHQLVIDAIPRIDKASLVVIGKGPMRDKLRDQVRLLGLSDRVRILDEVTQDRLVRYYNAADVLVLASTHEGMPNVVLESLACGTPVVATAVGGVPEIIKDRCAGRLLTDRSSTAIADAVCQVLADKTTQRSEIRAQVSEFDWERTVKGLTRIFDSVCGRKASVREQGART